jgi:hypothetical protein
MLLIEDNESAILGVRKIFENAKKLGEMKLWGQLNVAR